MKNTSASGGYLQPGSSSGLPGQLTLNQFVQSVLVGISALSGDLVRPDWQVAPPKEPDIFTNWMAFGIVLSKPDIYAYVATDANGVTTTQRHQLLEVMCSFYGPNAMDNASLVQDGFQITQNLEALRAANMGFVETNEANHIPDLVNERWRERVMMSIFMRREIQRVYPILPILSAKGTIHAVVGNQEINIDWTDQKRET